MRSIPCLFTAVLLFGPCPPDAMAEGESARGPNVVLILVDDLGYGDLSSYGATDLDTPHVDRLMERGMRMSNFYANCPVCSPTRASLLTGCYPDAIGVPGVIRTHSKNSWGYLSPKAVLLPAVLKERGYQTAMFGKWHLGLGEPNLPNSRGFDFFHGFLGDMMDDYFHHRRHGVNYMRLNRETIDPEGHATDLFTQWTCDWIKQYRDDAPFFIYLAYNAPHSPIQPPEDSLERYRAKHPDVPEKRAKLAALIEHLDAGIGRVLAALEETGRAKNTLVILTSDNGGSIPHGANNGPLAGGKQDMLEGGLRVPMCAVWPGRIKPGSRSDRVALTMDLFQTICEAAGDVYDPPVSHGFGAVIDGRSILPTLLGDHQPPEDRTLFWVRLEGGPRYRGKPYWCVREGDWKLVQNDPVEPFRVYSLADDPAETVWFRQSPMKHALLKMALEAHIDRISGVPFRLPDGTGPGEIGEPQKDAKVTLYELLQE
ncbi:MAG: sulfatase-like hydrolase/transferase [Planctomycetota bacterium]